MNQNHYQIEQHIFREYRLDSSFPVFAFLNENFSFPPEPETISWLHFHNCMELCVCLENRLLIVEKQVYSVTPGSVCIIPPNQLHNSKSMDFSAALEPHKCEYLYLDPALLLADFFTETYSFQAVYQRIIEKSAFVISPQENPSICRLLKLTLDEMRRPDPDTHNMVKGLILAFWIELIRFMDFPSNARLAKRRELTEVYPAMLYIREHYASPISIEILADVCGMSISAFRENFKKRVGMLPRDYIDNIRLSMAALLLSDTETSVLDIALQCGYNSLSSFNRHFTAKYGVSPSVWKKNQNMLCKRIDSHLIYHPKQQ